MIVEKEIAELYKLLAEQSETILRLSKGLVDTNRLVDKTATILQHHQKAIEELQKKLP